MKFNNWYKRALSLLLCIGLIGLNTFAAGTTSTTGFNELNKCDFAPDSGTFTATYSPSYVTTTLTFRYSTSDANAIANYKLNGFDNGLFACASAYAGIDIKSLNMDESKSDSMDAYSISSTLPNGKTDLESDDSDNVNEEAEVVALGTIKGNTTYNLTVRWNDKRDGTKSGVWRTHAELSYHGFSDYNVIPSFGSFGTPAYHELCNLTYGSQPGVANYASEVKTVRTDNEQMELSTLIKNTQLNKDSVPSIETVNTELTAYMEDAQLIADTVPSDAENIMATLTFNKYLDADEFTGFVDKHGINISQLQLRGYLPDGTRVSIFTRTDLGLPESLAMVAEQAKEEGYILAGITGANVRVDASNLKAIENDPLIYFADVSGDAQLLTAKNAGNTGHPSSGFPQALTWTLEDLGLMMYQD